MNRDARETKAWRLSELSPKSDAAVSTLEVGTRVFVRNRFIGHWSVGFEVVDVVDGGYRLRRLSDGQEFPDTFAFGDVMRERRRHPVRVIGESLLDRQRQIL
jgi:hypothetical protein